MKGARAIPRPLRPIWRGPCSSQESSQPWFHQDTALGKDLAGSLISFISTGTTSRSGKVFWLAVDIGTDDAAETQGPRGCCGSFHWLKIRALKVYTSLSLFGAFPDTLLT